MFAFVVQGNFCELVSSETNADLIVVKGLGRKKSVAQLCCFFLLGCLEAQYPLSLPLSSFFLLFCPDMNLDQLNILFVGIFLSKLWLNGNKGVLIFGSALHAQSHALR